MSHSQRIVGTSLPANRWEVYTDQSRMPRGQRAPAQNAAQRNANTHSSSYGIYATTSSNSGAGHFINGGTLNRIQPDLYEYVDGGPHDSIEFEISADGEEQAIFASAGQPFDNALHNELLAQADALAQEYSEQHAAFPPPFQMGNNQSVSQLLAPKRPSRGGANANLAVSAKRSSTTKQSSRASRGGATVSRKRSPIDAERPTAAKRRVVRPPRRDVTYDVDDGEGDDSTSNSPNREGSNVAHNKLCRTVVDLPLARIKTIMKTSPDVQSVGMLPLVAVTKSAELFIERIARLAFATRSGAPSSASASGSASTSTEISYNHLARLVAERNELDFLSDVIPKKILASDWLTNYKQLYEDE